MFFLKNEHSGGYVVQSLVPGNAYEVALLILLHRSSHAVTAGEQFRRRKPLDAHLSLIHREILVWCNIHRRLGRGLHDDSTLKRAERAVRAGSRREAVFFGLSFSRSSYERQRHATPQVDGFTCGHARTSQRTLIRARLRDVLRAVLPGTCWVGAGHVWVSGEIT